MSGFGGISSPPGDEGVAVTALPRTTLQDGDEIGFNLFIPNGQKFLLERVGIQNDQNNSVSNLKVRVFNEDNSVVEFSSSSKSESNIGLLLDGPVDLFLSMINNTGSPQVASSIFSYKFR